MKHLSIVIPTVYFRSFLDEAIESCLVSCKLSKEIIVVINNKTLEGFEKSQYYTNPSVRWVCLERATLPMDESWNLAVKESTGNWIFLLSDDDRIEPGFLTDFNLCDAPYDVLYETRIQIIDENGIIQKKNRPFATLKEYKKDVLQRYLFGGFHNHLSSFVFSRRLFNDTGGFVHGGYPNGYFIDTIFHGKLIARCRVNLHAKNLCFSRRESSFQASSKFYIGPVANRYLEIVASELWSDSVFADVVRSWYLCESGFRKDLMYRRFYTEWNKLGKRIYGNNKGKRLFLLLNVLFVWRIGARNRWKILYFLPYKTGRNFLGRARRRLGF